MAFDHVVDWQLDVETTGGGAVGFEIGSKKQIWDKPTDRVYVSGPLPCP